MEKVSQWLWNGKDKGWAGPVSGSLMCITSWRSWFWLLCSLHLFSLGSYRWNFVSGWCVGWVGANDGFLWWGWWRGWFDLTWFPLVDDMHGEENDGSGSERGLWMDVFVVVFLTAISRFPHFMIYWSFCTGDNLTWLW